MSTPTSPQSTVPPPAPDYKRETDGATMREVLPGEFVSLTWLIDNGYLPKTASL